MLGRPLLSITVCARRLHGCGWAFPQAPLTHCEMYRESVACRGRCCLQTGRVAAPLAVGRLGCLLAAASSSPIARLTWSCSQLDHVPALLHTLSGRSDRLTLQPVAPGAVHWPHRGAGNAKNSEHAADTAEGCAVLPAAHATARRHCQPPNFHPVPRSHTHAAMPVFQGCCAHDHDCEAQDCSSAWSLYKHIDIQRVRRRGDGSQKCRAAVHCSAAGKAGGQRRQGWHGGTAVAWVVQHQQRGQRETWHEPFHPPASALQVRCLNEAVEGSCRKVFKPWHQRLEAGSGEPGAQLGGQRCRSCFCRVCGVLPSCPASILVCCCCHCCFHMP